MSLHLLPDPGYARIAGRPVSREVMEAVTRDRAILLATMKREPVNVGHEVYFPIGDACRLSPEGWLHWSRQASRLGLTSYLPLWARVALVTVESVEGARAWFGRVLA